GRIMEAVGMLIATGEKANDPPLVDLGERIAMHAMSEIEVVEPSAQLVGETVRRALAAGN
ncbi:MAG: hypothetical protein IRY94_18615, partial [Rhodospirillaceae bacterium]|nr:hypothetical protein [Rhodospirillaceae bacterium]